ncbi:MAG TPA: 2'-5' RNA ligase family protein [Sphingomonas sp.]|jgi:2'-5' RNA ligase|uniref:2'-5' RNA ligase family protein n=1 Tax=Sphingomonas sp. TaxID=28214 RepID=UPI002EDB9AD0
MHRLFVAIRPARPLRDAMLAIAPDIDGARWQDDDHLHVTLRFIGSVERPLAEDIAAALAASGPPASLSRWARPAASIGVVGSTASGSPPARRTG